MAGDWIKIEHTALDKAEIRTVARMLKISHSESLLLHMRWWVWLDTNTVDGLVDGLVDADVDALLSTAGFCKCERMVGWLATDAATGKLRVVNFDNHNGETAKKRAEKNRRQSKWRANASANSPPEAVDGAVDAATSTIASTNASTREEKRRVINSKGLSRIGATPSPSTAKVNGQGQDPTPSQPWWSTLESMVAQAAKYGLVANTGESRDDFYQRIKFAMKRKG